ncbi:hypothetical protein [Tabrizicola sp.]|uniref:hypothetical protein n=1 Tax=Tabrizicola sp. TaxID=2005166 RepID=UPI003F2C1958
MKLTLHVGLKKTATTSLQMALAGAKRELAAFGVLNPGTPDLHQRLARSVKAGDARGDRVARETLDVIAAEARVAGLGHVVLSSEHLISASAEAVARLRLMLEEQWPEVSQILVLCYVREPVGFATSMCQQSLKNGVIRLADFYAAPWPFTVAAWLSNYATVFGRESIRLRHFHPDHLKDGDIFRDFLDAIGLPDLVLPVAVAQRNRSLSHEGVLVADALVGLRPGGERDRARRNRYRRLLGKIEGAKFVLPAEVQERVIEGSSGDVAALKAVFGLELVPERVDGAGACAMSAETALAMARRIIEDVER